MKPQCIAAVQAAAKSLGRAKPLTAAQLTDIDGRMSRTMHTLARTDPAWQSKAADQRLAEAAKRAMQDMHGESARKLANAQRQVVKTAATQARIDAAHGDTRSAKVVEDIDRTGDYISGIKSETMGRLMASVDAVRSYQGAGIGRRVAMFLFDVKNPAMTRDLAREIFSGADGSSGNKIAQAGAKAWLDTIEQARQRFNAGGGDVGKLDYGFLPQPHDQLRVRKAGRDGWVNAILPLLDRTRYVDEAGARLDDTSMRQMLGNVWSTIATDGLNKTQPGEFKGAGARANHGSETRELHFKGADGYLDYMSRYGRGSMYDAMISHVGRMSRDIGLVERYGPNPNAQMRLQLDVASHADGRPIDDLPRSFGLRPQSYWDVVNGTSSTPASARLAQIGTDVRNVMTMGKLGAAVISSITDAGTTLITTNFNKLPYWDLFRNYGRVAGSAEARRMLTAHGVIAESMAGDLTRWTNDNIKATWSGRLANSVLRLSLLNAWTDTLRRAFSLTMMQGMARMAGHDWGALTQWDRARLASHQITEADWNVIRQAQLTHFQGLDHLTPEAIRAGGGSDEIVAKVLGMIQDESEFAVINPDLATKAIASGGAAQRGTIRGELARSVMEFKSFPIAMVSRHWRRMMSTPEVTDGSAPAVANRLVYFGGLMLSTTVLGAIALQAKEIIAGRDPIDVQGPHAGKFWGKAVAQGGGLSIMGDMLLNDPGSSTADYAKNVGATLAGPAISDITKLAAIPTEAVWQRAKGKPSHAAADTLNVARSEAPYLNLWYAKAAVDHAFMQSAQENLSPGYLGRMRQRAQQQWGQSYWWAPGSGTPQRPPNLGTAVGQ